MSFVSEKGGQKKPVYIYRYLVQNRIEIYLAQTNP